jgi:hypothetical protein
MKYFKIIILLIILLFIHVQNIFAESKNFKFCNYNDPFINNNLFLALNDINQPDANIDITQYEHPLRRFEITFFISAPFTFIISFLSLSIYDTVKSSYEKKKYDGNVNVWKEYKIPLLAGTVGLSAAIASREAWICIKMNKEREDKSGKNQNISISITKYF